MLQQPKRTKYRKQFKGRHRGVATRGVKVSYGDYGLKAIQLGRLTARQLEALRRVVSRLIKRCGQVWIRVFPDKPITKKPLEVRQGSGKGSVEYYVALVRPGQVIIEIGGVPEDVAKTALLLGAAKLPIKAVFVARTIM